MKRMRPVLAAAGSAAAAVAVLWAAVALAPVTRARGQDVLDRVVGEDAWLNSPVIISALDRDSIGALMRATDVPIGLESALGTALESPLGSAPAAWKLVATGRRLREVLDAIVVADPRYDWREDNGVIVFRPRGVAHDPANILNTVVHGFVAQDIRAIDAVQALARLFGVKEWAGPGINDTRRFSVDVRDGSTVVDVLNAVVRSHGRAAWIYERRALSRRLSRELPFNFFLSAGNSGLGVGIHDTVLTQLVQIRPAREGSRIPWYNRIVGSARGERPLVRGVFSASVVADLAAASSTPMGIERSSYEAMPSLPQHTELTLTGMRLGDAVVAIAALDPRYEWKEMDGVIVFRPAGAWADASDPLFRLVPSVTLTDVTGETAVETVASLLDPSPQPYKNQFADTRRFSLSLPQGSALELLNGLAKAHGELSWEWEQLGERDRLESGARYRVSLHVFQGGGWACNIDQ